VNTAFSAISRRAIAGSVTARAAIHSGVRSTNAASMADAAR
jgi:hypothetical protein